MFSLIKNIFDRIINYTSYRNSSKLNHILYLGNYPDAKKFIDNHKFILTKNIISQWVSNVYATSNGAPIHPNAKEFNEKFMLYAKSQENHTVIEQYLKQYEFNPAILHISTNNFEFKGENQNKKIPYSQQNFENFTKWLIAQCTLNNFMEHYPHMIELLNQKFNIEDIYPLSNQKSEILKLFISIFHKQSVQQQNLLNTQVESENKKKTVQYFNFNSDYTNLPLQSQIVIEKISKLFIDWDWKKELQFENVTEESHKIEKILTQQIETCIDQYIRMPVELRESMRNHEGLNMNQLLENNLNDIFSTISEIKNNHIMYNAEQLLFKQTVQKTMLANQRSKSNQE